MELHTYANIWPVIPKGDPISTRRGRLCPPHYYWYPEIFIPSYGPEYISSVYGELIMYIFEEKETSLGNAFFSA